jgi:hypothetical protein
VSDGVQALFGLLLLVGLFVAYGVERRRKRRAPAHRASAPREARPAPATARQVAPDDGPPARSWELGCLPLAPSILLLLAATHRDDVWGTVWQAVFFAVVGLAAWSALSPREFAKAAAGDPGLSRREHILRYGAGFVLFPLVGWGLVVPLAWTPGFVVPAVPWAVVYAVAYAAAARRRTKA